MAKRFEIKVSLPKTDGKTKAYVNVEYDIFVLTGIYITESGGKLYVNFPATKKGDKWISTYWIADKTIADRFRAAILEKYNEVAGASTGQTGGNAGDDEDIPF